MKSRLKLNYSTYESSGINGLAMVFPLVFIGLIIYKFMIDMGNPETQFAGYVLVWIFAVLIAIGLIAVLYCYIKANIEIKKDPFTVKSMVFDDEGINLYFMDKSIQRKFYPYKDIYSITVSLSTVRMQNFSGAKFRSAFNLGRRAGLGSVGSAGLGWFAGTGGGQEDRAYISDIKLSFTDKDIKTYTICVTPFTWFQTNVHRLLLDLKDFSRFVPDFDYYFSGPKDVVADSILSAKNGKAREVYRNIQLAEFKKILLLSIPTVIAIIIVVTIVSWPFVSHFWGKCSIFDMFFNVHNCIQR